MPRSRSQAQQLWVLGLPKSKVESLLERQRMALMRDKKCRKGAILGAGVSSAPGEVVTAATAVARPVGHPKKSLTPEFQRI